MISMLEPDKEYAQAVEDELAARRMQKESALIKSGKVKLVPFEEVLKKAGITENVRTGLNIL